ncbi:Geranylgeranyl diphosphate synthase [Galdieria sulphuraria]|nr:Geranylgeranyl diphosphate synthase [Galdieria sulphuraria]
MAFVIRCCYCGSIESALLTSPNRLIKKRRNDFLSHPSRQLELSKKCWPVSPQGNRMERCKYYPLLLCMVAEVSVSDNLLQFMKRKKDYIEEQLNRSIPLLDPRLGLIYESMRYSLLAGGKRIRPILCIATCELFGGSTLTATPTAVALEMIHTMSLIHDDLPAMDNDDYRRGKLTNHKVFGEDIAILAGDALLARAFEYIANETQGVPAEVVLKVISFLGASVGYSGIVGGQVVDILSEGKKEVSIDDLIWIHKHKTGALLKCCVVTGALLGGAKEEDVIRVGEFAERIGLAFQVADDILDVTASFEELGKSIGKDERSDKATFPRLMGLEESKRFAEKLVQESKYLIEPYGKRAYYLEALADYIVSRSY